MAHHAWAGSGRDRSPARQRVARVETRAWSAGHVGDRKDHRGGRRRSAGDDRHLRSRSRSIAHALWPDDSIRTAEPSVDGAMASARGRRSDHCVQFSRRGLVVECRARRCLWRSHSLEAFGKNASHRNCGHKNRGARLSRNRRRSGDFHFADRRSQNGRPKAGRRRADSIGLGHRLGKHGFKRRENRSWPSWQNDYGTGREQRAHRHAERRHRDGDAIDLFRRGRHGWTTLHFHAARDHARVSCVQSSP